MLEYDFDESIGYWLTVTTQAMHRALTDELAPHGVTYRQAQVLAWLAVEGESATADPPGAGGLSQSELAAKMLVEPPTLVGILDRMERDGWITRNSCSSDRRKKLVRPTAAAEPAWEKFTECARRVRARATEGLSEEEVETLKRLLGQVFHNIETRPATVEILT
jgi:MarR family transcriptional regulator for hemolysin